MYRGRKKSFQDDLNLFLEHAGRINFFSQLEPIEMGTTTTTTRKLKLFWKAINASTEKIETFSSFAISTMFDDWGKNRKEQNAVLEKWGLFRKQFISLKMEELSDIWKISKRRQTREKSN